MIRHKSGVNNKVSDALSRRVPLLVSLQSKIIRFECLKKLYGDDEDFAEIWEKCLSRQSAQDFHIFNGFLLKGNWLCVSRTSLRESY